MIHQILVIATCSFYATTRTEAVNFNKPILPKVWQQLAGAGFSTTYFKSSNVRNKYKPKNIQDVYDRGFRNLRLRCRTGLKKFDMDKFLVDLEMVVQQCLKVGVVPIISWINHQAEAEGKDKQRDAYVDFWTRVAETLKDKDYRLAFNLFTELGVESECGDQCEAKNKKKFTCPEVCGESLAENIKKYNDWTRRVIPAIRGAGGNNKKRIIIMGSPAKRGDFLKNIPSDIYKGDNFIMAEWHIFASGPDKKLLSNGKPTYKYWGKFKGKDWGRYNVDKGIKYATDWTKTTGVETYFGAWMPQDNKKGSITTKEAIEFSKYLINALKPIPWSLNVLDVYYNTKMSKWKTGSQKIKGRVLDIPEILKAIEDTMDIPARKDESFENIPRRKVMDIIGDDDDM